jgi:twinkle protein
MTNEWFSDRLWVFKLTGTAKADRLLEIFAYARRRYGIDLFVIDNLAKCGLDEEDYGGQKNLSIPSATLKTSTTAMFCW